MVLTKREVSIQRAGQNAHMVDSGLEESLFLVSVCFFQVYAPASNTLQVASSVP